MRFNSLEIRNLRAIREFEVSELGDFVVIAGPNGSGKSCVLDAIRLLKSFYGGHSTDEHMQWFAEFAINPQDKLGLSAMFRDPDKPLTVAATLEYSDEEIEFLRGHGRDLILPIAWQLVTGQRMDHWSFNKMQIAMQYAQNSDELERVIAKIQTELSTEIDRGNHCELAIEISPEGLLNRSESRIAEIAFQAYEPESLGIIEFHSASRTYQRQPLGGINLDSKEFENQRRQSTLYNWQNKYQNVKSEIAAGYLRSLIRNEYTSAYSTDDPQGEDLNETLKELFRTFFPEKEFLGVRPTSTGGLEFPVKLPGGETHDIDDLSSGEKEILYGYLRLKNSTPRRSVILLDEPELHLNPGLLQGFADFYYRHLGVAQENQLWMVTHSDTLLRQAVGNSNYKVFHMLTAPNAESNQASEVLLDDQVETAVVELVGDLAAYQPHAKVVILEGGEEDGFDETFLRRLFPDFAKRVNLVKSRSKRHVGDLYALMDETVNQLGLRNRFFAIVDADSPRYEGEPLGANHQSWDVYHVENYLLDPECIRLAANALEGSVIFETDEEVMKSLKQSATDLVDQLVLDQTRWALNRKLVSSINLGGPSSVASIGEEVFPAVERSKAKIDAVVNGLSVEEISKLASRVRGEFEEDLVNDEWIQKFPGRLILRRFAGEHLSGHGYMAFRNVILDKMAQLERAPGGANDVVKRILDA